MPDLQSLYEEYKDKVQFIGVNCDSDRVDADDLFKNEKIEFNLPIIYDTDGKICNNSKVYGFPTTLLFDKEHNLVNRFVGSRDKGEYKNAIEKVLSN